MEDNYAISPGISQQEFERLLDDSTFVDFFNTFLSLPIFGKRLHYDPSDETFDIDPPIKRTCYHVIQGKVKTWVRRSRLPFFLKTDLFLEFSLCRLLLKSTTGSNPLIQMYLNSVEGMHAFRRFLRGTMGEHIFSFWLDAERFRCQTKPENRRYSFREIQSKYLRGGSPFELTELMKWKSLCGGLNSGLESKSFTAPIEITRRICQPDISVFSDSIFVPLQKSIIEQLKSYWVPKFVVHKEKIRMRYKDRRGRAARRESLMTDLGPDAAKLISMREKARMKEEGQTGDILEDITTMEEYMEMHKTDSSVSVSEEDPEEKERQKLARWHEWFWGIVDREENDEEIEEEQEKEEEEEILTPESELSEYTPPITPPSRPSTRQRKNSKATARKHSTSPKDSAQKTPRITPHRTPQFTPIATPTCTPEVIPDYSPYTPLQTPEDTGPQSTPTSVYSYYITGTPLVDIKSSSSSPYPLTKKASSKSKSSKTGSLSDTALSTPETLDEINKRLEEGKIIKVEDKEKGEEDKEADTEKLTDSSEKKKSPTAEQTDIKLIVPSEYRPTPTPVKATRQKRFMPKEIPKLVRANLAHPDQPYALTKDDKKGKVTMFEALHSEGGSQQDEWSTIEKRLTPEDVHRMTTLEAIEKAPMPRLIQLGVIPGDMMGIFGKPRTALPTRTLEYQRIIQDVVSQSGGILAAVAADRLAGGPFYDYLERIHEDTALIRLQFWNEAQRFLVPAESLGPTNKYRMAMAIIGTFLLPDSPRIVPINPKARRQLIDLLPIDQGDALLTHMAHNIIQDLSSLVLQFIRADEDHFTSTVTRYKKIIKVQPKVEEFKERETEEEEEEYEETDHESEEDASALANLNMLRALQLVISLNDPGYDDEDEDEEESDDGEKIPSLKEVNKQRDLERARRNSHFYGEIKKEVSEKKEEDSQVVKTRPNRPRGFQDCLYETAQFAWFRGYLQEQSSETPLLFWQAVENMKNNCKDAKSRQARANVIVRKYFINIEVPATENLQCKADIIRDIPLLDKVTPPMLISAQTCVSRTLEEQWFRKYVATFPEEDHSETLNKYAMRNTLAGVCKLAAHGKTRGLWAMFASNVRSFQKGINTTKLEKEFIEFLKKEKEITIEHNNRRHALNPTRRMINNRSIATEKLVNDLAFWKEVIKFKEMVDNATECAKSGNYSSDDQRQVESKANTINRVYIDSELPPRIQINISNEQAEYISNLTRTGIIERGIFHEAALSVFTALIHYWKKFMVERRKEPKKEQLGKKKAKPQKKKDDLKKRRLSFLAGIPYRRVYVTQDDEIRWTYSILNGLRLAVPVKMMNLKRPRSYGTQGDLGL